MKEEVVPEELLAEIQRLRIQNQRMAERIAYLERLLWGGKRRSRSVRNVICTRGFRKVSIRTNTSFTT